MDSIVCPKCGTLNFGNRMNCEHCRINLQFAVAHPDQIEKASVVSQSEQYIVETFDPVRSPSMYIGAPPPRYRSEALGNTLYITIPRPKRWSSIISLTFFMSIWTFAIGFVAWQIIFGDVTIIFLYFWILMAMFFEIMDIYHLLWQIIGKEEIKIRPDSIAIRHAILGTGLYKVYASKNVSNMRVDPANKEDPYPTGFARMELSKGTGMIAFDHERQMIRMGIGLVEAEAQRLIAEIQWQYPQYRRRTVLRRRRRNS